MVERVVVHILQAGRALCGFPGLPMNWPDGHAWVGSYEEMKSMKGEWQPCEECLKAATPENRSRR